MSLAAVCPYVARFSRWLGLALVAAFLGGAATVDGAVTAGAPPVVVQTTVDAPDANVGDGVCASAAGVCTLRAAIQETNAIEGAHVIELRSGKYVLTVLGALEDEGATGDLDIKDDLTIRGTGSPQPSVQASNFPNGGKDRVFDIPVLSGEPERINVVIEAVSVRYGHPPDQSGYLADTGGGIRSFANLTLNDVQLYGNTSFACGGGVASFGPTLKMERAEIVDNTVLGADQAGGGVCTNPLLTCIPAGCFPEASTVTIEDSSIRENVAGLRDTGVGGGIYAGAPAHSLKNVVLAANRAKWGGGLYVANGKGVVGEAVTIHYNEAAVEGGGIYNEQGVVGLLDSLVVRNQAINSGGGLYNGNGGNATFNRVSFVENNASKLDGGAIWNRAIVNLENSTLSNNRAGSGGGAIVTVGFGPPSEVIANNTTIYNNKAKAGGNAYLVNSYLTLSNSILAGSDAKGGDCIVPAGASGQLSSLGYNFISRETDVPTRTLPEGQFVCNFTRAGTDNQSGTDPRLEGLVFHKLQKELETLEVPWHEPLAGSPVIDVGHPGTGKGERCADVDQRRAKRPQDGNPRDKYKFGRCDIGSYEVGSGPPEKPGPAPAKRTMTLKPDRESYFRKQPVFIRGQLKSAEPGCRFAAPPGAVFTVSNGKKGQTSVQSDGTFVLAFSSGNTGAVTLTVSVTVNPSPRCLGVSAETTITVS